MSGCASLSRGRPEMPSAMQFFVEQIERQDDLGRHALERVIQSGAAIPDQALDEEYVQKDEERPEHGLAADAVADIQLGDAAGQEHTRLGGLVTVLRPQPEAEGFSDVMQDMTLQRSNRPGEDGALGMAVLDEGQAGAVRALQGHILHDDRKSLS